MEDREIHFGKLLLFQLLN